MNPCGWPAALALLTSFATLAEPSDFRSALGGFAAEMQQRHQFSPTEIEHALGEPKFRSDIIDAISRPAESKPWYKYRPIFVTPERARAGLAYWKAGEVILQRASQVYGVPPEIIVAIIGVETRYGRHTGNYRVVDALSTLAFGYPPRGGFFRRELEEYLLLSREQRVEGREQKGSYAGALGKPQFMPSSYRRYAVDFDGDGRKDLWRSDADVVGSVANYLHEYGWRPDAPITVPARAAATPPPHLEAAGPRPSIGLGELEAAGIKAEIVLPADTLVSLVRLENEGDTEYWLGLDNFYTITRYNHSNLYAMAVYQLSRDILALKQGEEPGKSPR